MCVPLVQDNKMTKTKTTISELAEKTFPIQGEGQVPDRTVPWFVAEAAYRTYSSKYGTRQSRERLAERADWYEKRIAELEKENKELKVNVV